MRDTPAWFRDISTFTSWPQAPKAHGPFGRDKITPDERRRLQGVPLYINVQGERGIREAHRLGGRALSYLSFMDTYVHTAGFERGTARVPWEPRKPQSLLLDAQGHFANTSMDSTWRMWRYQVCDNTREYVASALAMVREQMRRGADGVFVDNSSPRELCYGHGFPVGYSERYRGVITAIPRWPDPQLPGRKSPEELYRMGVRPRFKFYDRSIRELPKHRHIYPGRSHDFAYEQLLKKVLRLVRSYGRDKIVVVNGHTRPLFADGAMLEGFIYSWGSKRARKNWLQVKAEAASWRPYFARGGRVIALSNIGYTSRPPDEEALFSFAAATLLGYLWSDYGGLKSEVGSALRTLRLGKGLTALTRAGAVEYRFFERALVAINDDPRRRSVSVPACRRFGFSRLRDLADGHEMKCANNSWPLSLPAHSGRVCVGLA